MTDPQARETPRRESGGSPEVSCTDVGFIVQRTSVGKWRHRIAKSDLPHRVRLTAFTLSVYMDSDGFTYAGVRAIASGSGQAKKTVTKHIDQLLEDGWLEREWEGRGHTAFYFAAVPSGLPQGEDTEWDTQEEPTPERGSGLLRSGEWATSEPEWATSGGGPTSDTSERDQQSVSIPSELRPPCPPHFWTRIGPHRVCKKPHCGARFAADVTSLVSKTMRMPDAS